MTDHCYTIACLIHLAVKEIKAHDLITFWIFAAAIEKLPKPVSSPFYSWFFGFAHAIAAKLSSAKQFGFKVSPAQKVIKVK